MAKSEQLKTASVLAFERKLANSDAILFEGNWEQRHNASHWKKIAIKEKSVRGTISNRQKKNLLNDPAKMDQEVQKANLQTVDVAALANECDTLRVSFSLRVLGNLVEPSVCNNPEYQQALKTVITGYIEQHGFKELAHRYASNLANGRFLWRNRVGAESVEVRVTQKLNNEAVHTWEFNGFDLSLRQFDYTSDSLTQLSAVIEEGLKGDSFTLLEIEAFVKLGAGQEVFPSQELILDSNSKKSKVLYQVADQAAMHSQKIGNAIRTIDTWYDGAEELGAISVEPFGSVTSKGKAYRTPKAQNKDFYSTFDPWVLKGQQPEVEQQHYAMAILIRGGVFGEGKD